LVALKGRDFSRAASSRGQQRISTLLQYFLGSDELKLGDEIQPYAELPQEKKLQFLEYDVVVRDLGNLEHRNDQRSVSANQLH
jgi:hypothetical protein